MGRFGLLAALALFAPTTLASDATQIAVVSEVLRPKIAIVIDDVGQSFSVAERIVALPGPVGVAILPDTPYARETAELAHKNGKPVMLHLPMHTDDDRPLGGLGLTIDMGREQVRDVVSRSLESIPYVQGVNNHMGSLLTREHRHMDWVMEALRQRPELFFLDSRTTVQTVALQVARERGVPSTKRDVFLDPDDQPETVAAQWRWLLTLARRQGFAVAIGHPYPATLQLLEEKLSPSQQPMFELVSVRALIPDQDKGDASWQVSWFHSPKVSKNLKPLR